MAEPATAGLIAIAGASVISGLMGANSAKKERQAAERLTQQQIALERERRARAEQYIRERKDLLTTQLAQHAQTVKEVSKKRDEAYAEGNTLLGANLDLQLKNIQEGAAAQKLAIDTEQAAQNGIISDTEIKSAQSLTAQQTKETAARLGQDVVNEGLRTKSVRDVEAAQGAVKQELARVAGQTTPEGLAAEKSNIEAQAAQTAAAMKRDAAVKGRPGATSGANLALAFGKLKAISNATAEFTKGFAKERAGNIALLAGATNAGARERMALKTDVGDRAANEARYYGAEGRRITENAGNSMLASATAAGNQRVGVAQRTAAANLAALEAKNSAEVTNQAGYRSGQIADIAGNEKTIRDIQSEADLSERAGLGMAADSTAAMSKIYGGNATSLMASGNALYGSASQAIGKGLGTMAGVGADELYKRWTSAKAGQSNQPHTTSPLEEADQQDVPLDTTQPLDYNPRGLA